MLKKISTSLFLFIYLSVSTVSFADEVVLEIISETPAPVVEILPEPVADNIPEEIIPPVVLGDVVVDTPVLQETPTEENAVTDTSTETQGENVAEAIPEEIQDPLVSLPTDILNAAPEEIESIEITEVPAIVEVEKNSIFTPPGPEPEPWQPAVREDPTTESNTPVGDTATQSDPAFLAENSVSVRRMIENVVVDPTAKHSCKVDVFRTDISDTSTSTLLVKFYGISTLAAYDAEIGSLPNGIDVRFAKNNDYIYDFRGKETTLELLVHNQDGSLTGDFTIPIIYTQKGKKESSVICQLNIVNEEDEALAPPIAPSVKPVDPVVDPAQEFIEEILDTITPEPVVDIQAPITVEEIVDSIVPQIPPVIPPVDLPPVVVPDSEEGLIEVPTESTPLEPESDIVEPEVVNSVIVEPVAEIVVLSVENPPLVQSTPILSPDVSST